MATIMIFPAFLFSIGAAAGIVDIIAELTYNAKKEW